MDLIVSIKNIFSLQKGHERTIKAKKNIFQSFIIRGLNMLVSFLIVPITIDYLDTTRYGIWVTITSIVAWLSFFDVGLGHGLRNKFAESIAKGDKLNAKKYVSTSYVVLSIIVVALFSVFSFSNFFISWNKVLNISNEIVSQTELSLVTLIVVFFFSINLVIQLINTILTADQEPSKASLNELIGKALGLGIIWLLVKTTKSSLTLLGLAISASPVITFFVISIYLYNSKYYDYRPSLRFYDKSKVKELFNLSIKFFLIRISAILLYSTNNLIISHLFGPAEVTPYSIALSYFNVLFLLFNIVVSPFWSAITEAWVKKDVDWIKNTMRHLLYFWFGMVVVGIIMIISSDFIFMIWIGNKVKVSLMMSILVCIWVLSISWNGVYSQFLYGVGAIKIQSYLAIILSILNIPLAILFGRIFKIEGILLANIAMALPQMFVYLLQYSKIINQKAKGVWIT